MKYKFLFGIAQYKHEPLTRARAEDATLPRLFTPARALFCCCLRPPTRQCLRGQGVLLNNYHKYKQARTSLGDNYFYHRRFTVILPLRLRRRRPKTTRFIFVETIVEFMRVFERRKNGIINCHYRWPIVPYIMCIIMYISRCFFFASLILFLFLSSLSSLG